MFYLSVTLFMITIVVHVITSLCRIENYLKCIKRRINRCKHPLFTNKSAHFAKLQLLTEQRIYIYQKMFNYDEFKFIDILYTYIMKIFNFRILLLSRSRLHCNVGPTRDRGRASPSSPSSFKNQVNILTPQWGVYQILS